MPRVLSAASEVDGGTDRLSGGVERRLPVTAAQAGMWYAQELDRGNPLFRAAEMVEISGAVDAALLQESLRRVVTECETLRARFEQDGTGRVWQVIEPLGDWRLPVVDLRDEPDPAAASQRWMRADLARPVDLRCAPSFSCALLRLTDGDVFYFAPHHATLDGWGAALFFRRLTEVYSAFEEGRPVPSCPMGALEAMLADEAAYHEGEGLVRDRAYWAEQLAGWPVVSDPSQRWPKVPHSFVRATGHLDPDATERLRAVARGARTGLAPAAMAALALYVHRLSGRQEVVLDVTVHGRGAASRRVPTMLANVLPLRVQTDPGATVEGLLRHTTQQVKGVVRHQRYPYGRLVRELGRTRPDGPLHDWGINVMTHDARLRFGRSPAVLHNLSNGPVTGMGVNVYDRPADGSLRIDLNADPSAYSPEETAAHLGRFLHTLETLARGDVNRPVGSLSLVSPAEEQRLLEVGDNTGHPVPDTTLPDLFEARVREEPGALALVAGGTAWSRRELNTRANRLAHLLRRRGAGPETRVALVLPRTADCVAALLAVLKTGAVCLPMDQQHPADRIRIMLADAGPLCVVTTAAAPDFSGVAPVVLLDVPATADDLAARPVTDLSDDDRTCPLRTGHAAYLAFTSGTSGRPKGVVVEHAQLTNLYFDHESELIAPAVLAAGRPLRAALTASFSFDTAWEGMLFLAAGQELHLVDDAVRHDPQALVGHVRERRIDFLDITPSHLRPLLAAGLLSGVHRPRLLMVGGEAFPQDLWEQLRTRTDTTVYNYYGPTECTVDTVYCRLDEHDARPVLGRPGRNVRAYVLDGARRLTPHGLPGELYLAGRQVARGYLDPGQTAERFVADPYGPAGSRMYRTGDRVRWTRRGTLEYLGRADDQVKIRGVRIEPQEIENVLVRHPRLIQAAVTVDGSDGNRRLTAHVVPGAGGPTGEADGPADGTPGPAELRAWAAARLPTAMVPTVFVVHRDLPRTVHGKLDRAALRTHAAGGGQERRAARTEQERTLCKLMAEVLDVPDVCVDDDFFALGGHSLHAARMIARVHAEFGVGLSIGALYQAPTVSGLAALLEDSCEPDALTPLLPLRTAGDLPPLFCVRPTGGLGWCYAALPHHLPARLPVYALQAQGLRAADPPPATFPELVDGLVRHIRSVQPEGPYHLLGFSLGGALAHAVAVRLQAGDERVALLAMLDSQPIDPTGRLRAHAGGEVVRDVLADAADDYLRKHVGVSSGPSHDGGRPSLPVEHMAAVRAVIAHDATLLPTFTEGVFDGDLVYVRAGLENSSPGSVAESWLPWVTGSVQCHDVPCLHGDMTRPEALARVGRILTGHFELAADGGNVGRPASSART